MRCHEAGAGDWMRGELLAHAPEGDTISGQGGGRNLPAVV